MLEYFWGSGSHYGDFSELKKALLYHKIVRWTNDELELDNGTVIEIVESEQCCCAGAGGRWKNVQIDAVITDVSEPATKEVPDEDTHVVHGTVTLFHNRNTIAVADCEGNAGNGGYYYSIASLKIGKVHYKVLEA